MGTYRQRDDRTVLRRAALCLLVAVCAVASLRAVAQSTSANPAPVPSNSAVLDRVVAVVGRTAILASDVDEEMRFAALEPYGVPAADNTPQRAMNRLIDRTLIDRQRALQPGIATVSDKDVDARIAEMRKQIPECAKSACATDAGWQAFLQAHGFTEQEVRNHVRERLQILKFIDVRFGVAIRIPAADVRKYYDQVLVPELQRAHAKPPEYRSVAPRIREILRQQQVAALLNDWLKSLRKDGELKILDPAYGDLSDTPAAKPPAIQSLAIQGGDQ